MKDELTGCATARSDAETIDDIVETALAESKHDIARNALFRKSTLEEQAEIIEALKAIIYQFKGAEAESIIKEAGC